MRVQNPLLEIDLAAICSNYRRFAGSCPQAEAAAVVKCDAYGLGAATVGQTLAAKENCRAFFVAYSEEGAALREALGAGPEIYVFNGPFPDDLSAYRQYRLTPVINSLEQARLWASAMNGAPAAVNFDTGMHRLGMRASESGALRAIDGLNVTIVMSHLACASDAAHPMNERQLKAFLEIAAAFPNARKSLSSSGGALIDGPFGFDQVRLGVGLYGVSPLDAGTPDLRPVARLTAPVIQTHMMKAGETVGYGATFTAPRALRLATVSLGYGDGFPRAGSNRAKARLGGAVCCVVGRVSMDLTVLDVTDAPMPVSVGDRAEFFGPNWPIELAAADCGTIGYELLTSIGGLSRAREPGLRGGLGVRVQRRYLWEGAAVDVSATPPEGN